MKPRNGFLLGLEGWYTTAPQVPIEWKPWYDAWLAVKAVKPTNTPKFTTWLSREYDTPVRADRLPGKISQLGEQVAKLQPEKFKISCRHNDLFRLGKSPHYTSCMTTHLKSLGRQMRMFAEDPNVAVVYIPDAAGHFKSRFLIRSVVKERKSGKLIQADQGEAAGLLVYPNYGQVLNGVVETLCGLAPLYESIGIADPNNALYNLTPVRVPYIYEDVPVHIGVDYETHYFGRPYPC